MNGKAGEKSTSQNCDKIQKAKIPRFENNFNNKKKKKRFDKKKVSIVNKRRRQMNSK